MGYRSDVRIRTTKKGYEIMKAEVENFLKENNLDELWNLLKINGVSIDKTEKAIGICFATIFTPETPETNDAK